MFTFYTFTFTFYTFFIIYTVCTFYIFCTKIKAVGNNLKAD